MNIERTESKITDIDDINLEKVNKQRTNSASSASIESSSASSSSSSWNKSKTIENVLILQGGGSLGAFGCGVFKVLAKRNIKLDIVAGTSIGGVNAAIIAGSKNEEHPEKVLEEFWMDLSNSFIDLKKHNLSYFGVPHFIAESLSSYYYSYPVLGSKANEKENNSSKKTREEIRLAQFRSFASSAIFGNDKMFKPR